MHHGWTVVILVGPCEGLPGGGQHGGGVSSLESGMKVPRGSWLMLPTPAGLRCFVSVSHDPGPGAELDLLALSHSHFQMLLLTQLSPPLSRVSSTSSVTSMLHSLWR